MSYAKRMRTLLLIAVAATMAGCGHFHIGGSGVKGSGKVVKKTLSFADFKSISHESVSELVVTVGGKQNVEIETDDNILPLLVNEVKDGTLTMDTKQNISPTKLVYRVTVPTLESLSLEGVGSGEVTGIDGKSFKANLTGVGSLKLAGKTDDFNAEVSGVGSLDAFGLQAKTVKVEVSGVGSANVFASETLDATTTGVGSIEYKGDAKAKTKADGIGSVSKVN